MERTDRLSLADMRERDGERWSAVLDGAGAASGLIPGAILEAQFQAADGAFLVFTTQDVPFEEQLDLVLLDRELRVLDRATLAAAYATGALRDLRLDAGDSASFSFFGQDRWRVACSLTPRWRLPRLGPPGLQRAPRLRSRLRLDRRDS